MIRFNKLMSLSEWFSKKSPPLSNKEKLNIPGDVWVKCPTCQEVLFLKELEQNNKVCMSCQHHFRLDPMVRIKQICDKGSFKQTHTTIGSVDFLGFEDSEKYADRLEKARKKTGRQDAIVTGNATIKKLPINIGVMDFGFLGGSMGSVVGEKITRLIEDACHNRHPVIIFTASGGARMQEGLMSLMQMGKTSAALYRLGQLSIPFISVLCDPTTGGTSASFAMLGDLNIAEPNALISFAGPRVIEQTIRQKLPKGFQRSEFLLQHGMLDLVIHRKELPDTLYTCLKLLTIPESTPV